MSVRVVRQGRSLLRVEAHQGFLFWAVTLAALVLAGGIWNKWSELDLTSTIGMGVTVAGFLGAGCFFSERRTVLFDRHSGQTVIAHRRFPFAAKQRSFPLDQIIAVRREWGPSDPTEPRTVRPVLVLGSGANREVVPLIPGFETRHDDFDGVIAEIERFLA